MTGSPAFVTTADSAAQARERLDRVAASAAVVEDAQRTMLGDLVELYPKSAWLAVGVTSAKRWLLAYTRCSEQEAHRLERLAGLCHRHPQLGEAVLSGTRPSLEPTHSGMPRTTTDSPGWPTAWARS